MRGLTRRWVMRDAAAPPDGLAALRLPPLFERVLLARGLGDPDAVERFCAPKLTHLHDPVLLPGLDEAARRLVDAVRASRSLCIYGDYDVDGITATAILYHVIRAAAPGADVRTYVPHRLAEGYGLSADALRQIRDEGCDLAVSVDCGITAIEPARVARAIGLELIITDHHNPPAAGDALPDALVVHPRRPDGDYPFGELCGAGVAYKLAWRFATTWEGSERLGERLRRTLLDLLPLVALGTIADMVPLVEENRVLTRYGLSLIKASPIAGLQALITSSSLAGENIDADRVGFTLAPRLNACGRLGHAREAVHMLTAASDAEATRIAEELARLNQERQATERRIVEQAAQRAEEAGMTRDDRRVIVLADEAWHPGVIGIVCSRLVERFGRPAILLQRDGDACRGSARSIEGYSIHGALHATSAHLETFGGHDAAAGLALRADRLDAFVDALTEHANAHITTDDLVPRVTIDCDARLEEVDMAAVDRLQTLAPFGRGNRRPTIRVQGVTLAEPPRAMGKDRSHLQLRVRGATGSSRGLRCVWWREGARADAFAAVAARGAPVDLVLRPRINEWGGRRTVEGDLCDVRVDDAVDVVTVRAGAVVRG